MKFFSIFIISTTILFSNYEYNLIDSNSSSPSFEQVVGPQLLNTSQVTVHYFGHFNWGTCTVRFGQVRDVVENLYFEGYENKIKLFGIGKTQHQSSLSNWTNGNNTSVCMDESPENLVWNSWNANQRDLFILDHAGNLIFQDNISSGVPNDLQSTLIELIEQIPIDQIPGDMNTDGGINVLDIVLISNLIFINEYNETGDVNMDGILNVLDIVLLINVIIGT